MAQQAIGVLIGPPFPGGIRMRKISLGLQSLGYPFMFRKLLPVVKGDRVRLALIGFQQLHNGFAYHGREFFFTPGLGLTSRLGLTAMGVLFDLHDGGDKQPSHADDAGQHPGGHEPDLQAKEIAQGAGQRQSHR